MNRVKILSIGLFASIAMLQSGTVEAASGNGVITVTSDPTGANFSLYSYNGVRLSGVTPKTFKNLEAGSYTVSYGPVANCRLAKLQTRPLSENGNIHFFGDYLCDNEIPVSSSSAASTSSITQSSSSSIRTQQNLRISNAFHQAETLPGNSALVTIGIRNISKTTLRNLHVSQSFDPTQVQMPQVLPKGGIVYAKQIIWNIPTIYAGQSWTATFPVTMNENLQTGDLVELIALVTGDDVVTASGELHSEVAAIGISSLPATGAKDVAVIAILLVALLGTITTLLTIRRKKAVVLTV